MLKIALPDRSLKIPYSRLQPLIRANDLTYWGRETHICVSKLTIIGSDSGLSPGRRQAIIWPNAGILLIGPLGINFSEILIEIITFSVKKMHLEISSAKWRPFCLSLNVLNIKYGIVKCGILAAGVWDGCDPGSWSACLIDYFPPTGVHGAGRKCQANKTELLFHYC